MDPSVAKMRDRLAYIVGSKNRVFFDPPSDYRIDDYPCIIFKIDSMEGIYADNIPYSFKTRYRVHLLTKNAGVVHATNIVKTIPYAKMIGQRGYAGIIDYEYLIYQ